jgi:hypothetical protein
LLFAAEALAGWRAQPCGRGRGYDCRAMLDLGVWLALSPVGERIDLRWTAPDRCPTEVEVREAIGAYLGREEFSPALDDVVVDGEIIEGAERSFLLAVEVHLPEGTVERTVEAARCAELRDAAALIIAVGLDPLRVARAVPPLGEEPAPAPPEPPPPAPPPVVLSEKAPPPPKSSGRTLFADLRFGGALEVGAVPGATGGLHMAVALVGPRFRVEVTGRYMFPRRIHPFAAPMEAGIDVQSGAVAVRGCFVPHVGPVEFPSCAQVEGGVMRGRGVGVSRSEIAHRPYVGVVVGQELVWHSRRRIGLWVGADGVLFVLRPLFVVDDLGTALEGGWAAFRALAGPSVRI